MYIYRIYQLIIWILIIELVILLICSLAIVLNRIISNWKEKRDKKIQQQLNGMIQQLLLEQIPLNQFEIPPHLQGYKNLLLVLEGFDHLFRDLAMEKIKQKIIYTYLWPKAEKMSQSKIWTRRQLAVRCWLLLPKDIDENKILPLLHDSQYLVRAVSAVCMIRSGKLDLIPYVLCQMSQETDLARYPYRDALISSDRNVFSKLEEVLKTSKDPLVSLVCLDVLSERVTENLIPIISPYLSSEDRRLRLAALKVLGNIPGNEAIKFLSLSLHDPDWEVRAESAKVLGKMNAVEAIPELAYTLKDKEWWVRLQAAWALKEMGDAGKKELVKQDSKSHPEAYDISQYVMGLMKR